MRRLLAFVAVLIALFTVGAAARADDDPKHDPKAADPKAGDHKPAADPKAAHGDAPKADAHKDDGDAAKGGVSGEPEVDELPVVKRKISLDVKKITNFKLDTGSFEAEFVIDIQCETEPCKPKLTASNGELKGKPENIKDEKLHKTYKYKGEFFALVDLSEFPFDEHVLPIQLVDETNPLGPIEIAEVPQAEDVPLPGWTVLEAQAAAVPLEVEKGVNVQQFTYGLHIKRPKFQGFMKNFAPPFTMVIVLIISLFMKPKMVAPRLAAGTGSLVGVVTFHMNITNGIPPLGFFTRIDKFMFTLYLLWLVHIGLSIMIMRSEDAKDEKRSSLLYLLAWGLVPGVAAIMWTLVFSRLI